MDFRFVTTLRDYLLSLGLKNQYDLVSVAGAAKNLVNPNDPKDPAFILRQIDISVRLHSIKEVIVINHLDCGAYGKIFSTKEEERQQHETDLAKAKTMIQVKFPQLKVRIVLVGIHPTGEFHVEHVGEIEEI